jgi:hypothetical protein
MVSVLKLQGPAAEPQAQLQEPVSEIPVLQPELGPVVLQPPVELLLS